MQLDEEMCAITYFSNQTYVFQMAENKTGEKHSTT